jgi:hypothetical protein
MMGLPAGGAGSGGIQRCFLVRCGAPTIIGCGAPTIGSLSNFFWRNFFDICASSDREGKAFVIVIKPSGEGFVIVINDCVSLSGRKSHY